MAKIIRAASRRKYLTALFFDEPVEVGGDIYDHEIPLLIHRDTFDESPYKEGSELSDDEIEELAAESEYSRAKSKGLWLLSGRDYSKSEMEKRLCRDFDEEAAEAAAERLEELGLINDEAYARRKAENLLLVKKISTRAALSELLRLGIDRETAQEALDEIEYDPAEQITELINRKYSGWDEDEKIRNRMIAALQRRGFSYSDIRDALEDLEEEE